MQNVEIDTNQLGDVNQKEHLVDNIIIKYKMENYFVLIVIVLIVILEEDVVIIYTEKQINEEEPQHVKDERKVDEAIERMSDQAQMDMFNDETMNWSGLR